MRCSPLGARRSGHGRPAPIALTYGQPIKFLEPRPAVPPFDPAPDVPVALRRAVEADRDVALLIDPQAARILAASPAGARLFGQETRHGRDGAIGLDAAMPAVRFLRAHLTDPDGPQTSKPLIFWTRRGALQLACTVERASSGLVIVRSRQAAAANGSAPVHQSDKNFRAEPLPPRTDFETMLAIARRIREGQRHGLARDLHTPGLRAGFTGTTHAAIDPPVAGGDDLACAENGDSAGGTELNMPAVQGSSVPAHTANHQQSPPEARRSDEVSGAEQPGAADSSPETGAAAEPTNPKETTRRPHGEPDSERASANADKAPAEPSDLPRSLNRNIAAQPSTTRSVPPIDIAKLAHELKTPLSAIAVAAEIMRDERFGPITNARYQGYVTDIAASARHALDLIGRMLDRPDASQKPPELRFERLVLDDLLEGSVSTVMPLAEAKGVRIKTARDRRSLYVTADATSLRQIVFNLLTNAIKFTPRGGTIDVSTTTARDGTVLITVADTGPGMSAGEIADALKPVPLDVPHVREGGGLGLGLPLAASLAEANGARLTIDSAPRAGTRVQIAFPKRRIIGI